MIRRLTLTPIVLAFLLVNGTSAFSRFPGFASFVRATATSLNTAQTLELGQILLPSTESEPTQFDTACVVHPVVLPPSNGYDKWQLYYYGNFGHWKDGSKGFLPTGWCGLAESDDGIHWTKILGPLERGSILAPSEDPEAWDSVHVGVGDVIRLGAGELIMYYFGGGSEMVEGLGGPTGTSFSGIRMRIGRAKSVDNGRTWERLGVCLDFKESEGLFASWPRIIRPDDDTNKPWQMLYHAFNGSQWRVFGALSIDEGKTWIRRGLLLQGEEKPDSFDVRGIGTRAVTGPWKDGMLMVFEGVDKTMTHRLGAAYCSDINGDGEWEKLGDLRGCSQPGGPIAAPGEGAMGAWTTTVVGTPYLVTMPDGSLRLYHCGRDSDHGHSIGLLVSESGDIAPDAWKPVALTS